MGNFNDIAIVKRMKSLLWRASMMAIIAFVAFVSSHLTQLEMPTWLVTILGLGLGEVSKYLNTKESVLESA